MSIKKLFGSVENSRNYLAETNQKNVFKDVESTDNLQQLALKQTTFVPQIDYSKPENFAKFGSAYYYYSGAMGRIVDYYPYDGSDAEQNEFYNKSLDVEKYIFNNLFPRTNGYANFDSSSYIDFKGGPHGVIYNKVNQLFDNPNDSKRLSANLYDKNIYETAGLPDSYGTGSRESNLRTNFNSGITVEFWLKSRDLAAGKNQVIFDMWNDNASGSHDMGRFTLEVHSASSGSPFKYTVQSGSTAAGASGPVWVTQESIGQTITTSTLSDWNHYSFVFQNSGSNLVAKFYLNGYLNHTVITGSNVGELPSKDMKARIGALITSPFRLNGTTTHLPGANAHTLTGSIDEFRFWKAARSAEDVGRNWFNQVRGGTNTDINNTTLGVYYKFNEGTSGYGYLDSNVLDYSGRLTNGTWTGTPSRTLSSAIVEASAAASEYKDPIIYANHPDVVNVRQGLFDSGSYHDHNNTSNLKTLIPSWVLEQHEALGNTNVELLTHIMGAYFDKIYNQIEAIPKFKQLQMTSASYTPLPFAEHLPQSLGLYMPELFVDSKVISRFANKTDDFRFDGDLTDTKNLIYQNLYNNLTNIYKTKGTEKTIKNVFRCFNLDDTLIKLKTYADNTVYDLDSRTPRLEQTLINKSALYFNTSSHINATCFQYQNLDDTTATRGYISASGPGGYEQPYGFTAEASFTLPSFNTDYDSVDREWLVSSLYGAYSASARDPDTNTSWQDYDSANFQVYVIKEEKHSSNAFFMLSSSFYPSDPSGPSPWTNPNAGPFPILTSSVFFNTYNNSDWNISVRLKPSTYGTQYFTSGSDINRTYELVFSGLNTNLGTIENSFHLTASVSKTVAEHFLSGSKRFYAGANRQNFSGTVNHPTDIRLFNAKYWTKYIDDDSLKQHLYDVDNSGISGSFKNLSALDPNTNNLDLLNINTLALDWNFSDVTGSDAAGQFLTKDMSSGSAEDRRALGWLGKITRYKHPGRGHGFIANSTAASKEFLTNTFKFIDPESPISSDMVVVATSDDVVYGFTETIPNFHHTIEKSMYAAVSDEMLNFFAGVLDFNNAIGEPVNRYRARYKKLEKLREAFFRRVTTTSDVEKFVEYYQWFDDTISQVIGQLMPASSKFTDDTLNIVESHVLERNKYKSQFPTIEFRLDDPITPIMGINERLYNWRENHSPITTFTGSNKQMVSSQWWKERAERQKSDISSGNEDVDAQRDNIRRSIENDNNQKLNMLSTLSDGVHSGSIFRIRKLSKPYRLTAYRASSPVMPIKGGVNFEKNKKIDLSYNAIRPHGPVNQENNVYVPENVLYSSVYGNNGEEDDTVRLKNTQDPLSKPSDKVKRVVKVQFGRDWEEGIGYKNLKSDILFPFNIISGNLDTGYQKAVTDRVMSGVILTNLHNDVYGPEMERPMQGPFTDYAVGGHQSRHIKVNKAAVGSNFPTGEISMNTIASIEGRTVTISDGGTSVSFTFKGSPSNPEDVEIDGDTTTTMENFVSVVNSYPGFTIKAAITSNGTASLTNFVNSPDYTVGNIPITSTGAWMYAISGMTGGSGGLDRWDTRPEAWKILLGKCADPPISGAIGMVGPDYPLPNAPSELGQYPHTASQKAVYYRGFTAKRPVNIRNIRHTTGSTILGNYNHNYQIIQAAGAHSNPRQFIEKQPNLPTTIRNGNMSSSTSVRTLLDIHRGSRDGVYNVETGSAVILSGAKPHTDFSADYSTDYLQGGLGYTTAPLGGQATTNNSVITSKFGHRGGIEVMTRGYQDFRAGEYSVYNTINNRNLTVRRPFQSPPIVSGSAEENGIRVFDIHGNDYGQMVHAARHTERFFRDSILVTSNQGATYDEKPAYHRVHRNNIRTVNLATERYDALFIGPELNNENFARSEQLSSSNTFMLVSNNNSQGRLSGTLFPAITGAGGPGRSVDVAGQGGSGFTWSGWIRFGSTNTNNEEGVWAIGNRTGNTPLIRLAKQTTSNVNQNGVDWKLVIDARTNGSDGKTVTWTWRIPPTTDFSSSWNHVALVWGRPDDGTIRAQPVANGDGSRTADGTTLKTADSGATFYVNGLSQSYYSFVAGNNAHNYEDRIGTKSNFKGFSSAQLSGNTAFILGGEMGAGGNSTTRALFADIDEYSFWEIALDSGSIQELYNDGIVCDITASTLYENSGSFLWDWLRFEEAADTSHFRVDSDNPGTFGAQNSVLGFNTSSWIPMGNAGGANWTKSADNFLTGCQPVFSHYYTTTTFTCSNLYDNLNQSHPIPRSDRQYAWFTGAIQHPDPCSHNFRYSGYMPLFGEQQGRYSASTGYEPWLTMISGGDFGVYHGGSSATRRFGGTQKWAENYSTAIKNSFQVQDFVGLNTIIYEPISSSLNILGYPLGIPLFSRSAGTTGHWFPVANEQTPHYMNRSYKGQNAYINDATSTTIRGSTSGSYSGGPNGDWTSWQMQGYLFNALMLKRNGPYGYGTHAQFRRNPNHPVLRNERSSSEISVIATTVKDVYRGALVLSPLHWDPYHSISGQETTTGITNFTLPPVSMRGRPAILNYSPNIETLACGQKAPPSGDSITLKITDNNNKIFFNSDGLNTYADIDPDSIATPLDYVLASMDDPDISWADQNYLIYEENIFPSERMEFVSSSRRRTNYNNMFWRDLQSDRVALGNTMLNSAGAIVSQSAWCLDAQEDFLTRTASVASQVHLVSAFREGTSPANPNMQGDTFYKLFGGLRSLGKAGELQNNYTQFYFDPVADGVAGNVLDFRNTFLRYTTSTNQNAPGALYARKHMMPMIKSVVSPSGMLIPETGTIGSYEVSTGPDIPDKWKAAVLDIASGEALWEADEQAGIIEISKSFGGDIRSFTPIFKSYKSKPWYDNYQDFREEIRILAKDYAIVPEFRISEHVKNLIDQPLEKFVDYLEIPGTVMTATTSSFYRDYANSEKLSYFNTLNNKTTMRPTEIRLTVHAVKKFNPYKGFYPAQRTLDLAAKFSEVYFDDITTAISYQTSASAGSTAKTMNTAQISSGSNAGTSLLRKIQGQLTRPIMSALFGPGITYNAIKSGMAVDYPVLHGGIRKPASKRMVSMMEAGESFSTYGDVNHVFTGFSDPPTTPANPNPAGDFGYDSSSWTAGTTFWDERLPFETVIDPEAHLVGKTLADLEPHPSGASPYTASLSVASNNPDYELMARNFYGETARFFLGQGTYSSLISREIPQSGIFIKSGSVYGARIKMRRSMQGARDYSFNYTSFGYRFAVKGQGGLAAGYSANVHRFVSCSLGVFGGRRLMYNSGNLDVRFGPQTYPLPQDPFATSGSQQRETFTMYSRTTAFGPPVAGTRGANGIPAARKAMSGTMSGALDCFNGYNWSFTPPYYHGESWADVLFVAPESKKFTADEILKNSDVVYWRVDPGPDVITVNADDNENLSRTTPAFIYDSCEGDMDIIKQGYIMGGRSINDHAMQISASVNLFGIQRSTFAANNAQGLLSETRNETKAMRWVIKPKFETPMLNFNSSIRDVSVESGSLTLPSGFGSGSVPRGMWHQFGIIEPNRKKGIFLEIDDIPSQWLKHHYKVINENTVYNQFNSGDPADPESYGNSQYERMQSLTDLFGFNTTSKKVRLGALARKRVVHEAVVLIPYVTTHEYDETLSTHPEVADDNLLEDAKQFFGLNEQKVQAAIRANAQTSLGTNIDVAGESVRKLIAKMDRYILPPEFDFIRNPETTPIVMYIFEFNHKFDMNDLSYMWQNLAPRDYKKIRFQEESIAHRLDTSELLSAAHLLGTSPVGGGIVEMPDIRFMAFKVKQKATGDYYNHVLEQAGRSLAKNSNIKFMMPGAIKLLGSLYSGLGVTPGEGTELAATLPNPPPNAFDTEPAGSEDAAGQLAPAQPPIQAYEVQYNWPYDYLSIVEGIKVDVQILYDDESNTTKSLIREQAAKIPDATYRPSKMDLPGMIQSTQVPSVLINQAAALESAGAVAGPLASLATKALKTPTRLRLKTAAPMPPGGAAPQPPAPPASSPPPPPPGSLKV